MKKKVIFLMGPTAVGKTETAVCLAKKINAEIINCDSMQGYKEMDISTSMPAKFLREEIPHHLFDFISPACAYNAHRFLTAARKKIKEIIANGKTPLFTGGSGLYMKAVIDGFFEGEKPDLALRRSLGKLSSVELFVRLKETDPVSAKEIHPNNKKRIIRALEVYYKDKKPISVLKKTAVSIENDYDIKIFVLNIQRAVLYERINKRVDEMFAKGLLAEVEKLAAKRLSKTARNALGVKQLLEYVKGGLSLDAVKILIKRDTRRYAKRQLTWFRAEKRAECIEVSPEEKPQNIAEKIIRKL